MFTVERFVPRSVPPSPRITILRRLCVKLLKCLCWGSISAGFACSLDPSVRPEHRHLVPSDANQVRAEFRSFHHEARSDPHPESAWDTDAVFVFIPGYRFGMPPRGTLGRAKTFLEAKGIKIFDLNPDSFGTSEANAASIGKAMEEVADWTAKNRKNPEIVLVCQSKGMVDALYYLKSRPPSAKHIKALVGITPATQGTPLARIPPASWLPGLSSLDSRKLDRDFKWSEGPAWLAPIQVMTVSAQPALGFMDPLSILALPINWRAIQSIALVPLELIRLPFGFSDGLVQKASTYLPGTYDLGSVYGDHALAFTRRQQVWTLDACCRLLISRGTIRGTPAPNAARQAAVLPPLKALLIPNNS